MLTNQKTELGDLEEKFGFDSIIVHFDKKLRVKWYANEAFAKQQHSVHSISKSLVGVLYGMLVLEGALDPEKIATVYAPEFKGTVYDQTKVRHISDIQVNLSFNDLASINHYVADTGDSYELEQMEYCTANSGWKASSTLVDYTKKFMIDEPQKILTAHGATLNYFSNNTNVLLRIIEDVADEPFHALFSRKIWSKIGAHNDAFFGMNIFGESTGGEGGISGTAMDLLRYAFAMQNQEFDAHYHCERIHTRPEGAALNPENVLYDPHKEFLKEMIDLGITHYVNFTWLAANPYNGVKVNFFLGIYGQVVMYILEDDFIYVAQSSYNKSVMPPVDAHIEAAYLLHNLVHGMDH